MPLPRSKLAIREFDISEFESHMPVCIRRFEAISNGAFARLDAATSAGALCCLEHASKNSALCEARHTEALFPVGSFGSMISGGASTLGGAP